MTIYRFDRFELDSTLYELRREGEVVQVEAKTLDLLLYLVAHHDRLVSKQELLDNVWQGVTVKDQSVTQAIYSARRLLQDDSRCPRFLKTIRGRGHRFVGEVTEAISRRAPSVSREPGSAGVPTFVGRTNLLSKLEEALENACSGRGQLILLSGEPGIGKTRLAEEFCERARRLGAFTHFGHCPESEGAPPFWPWVQLLRTAAAVAPSGRVRELFGRAPHLATIAPDIAGDEVSLPEVPDSEDPGSARFRLFDAVTRFWSSAAEVGPVVLVLDDLHRADEASWLLLAYMARELGSMGLVVLGTYREADLQSQPVLSNTVARLTRDTQTSAVALAGLSEEEVALFVELTHDGAVEAALVEDLFDRTAGNPFFLTHLVRLAATEEGGPLPSTLREAIARQLDGLPAACRTILTEASVIGRSFPRHLLETTWTPTDLDLAMDAAARAGVVAADPTRPGYFRFHHVLVRDALYEGLPPAERAHLHSRVATAMEATASSAAAHLAELARHHIEAVSILGFDKAIAYSSRAGHTASEALAFEEAAIHFRRALGMADSFGAEDELLCDLLLALGEAQTRAGDREPARQSFRRAAQLARRLGAAERLAQVALAVSPGFFAIEVGVYDPFTVSLLDECLAALPESDRTLRTRVLARQAMALYWSDEVELRCQHLEAAMGLDEVAADPALSAFVLSSKIVAQWSPDNLHQRKSLAPALVAAASKVGNSELGLMGRVFSIASNLEAGRGNSVEREIEALGRAVAIQEAGLATWYASMYRAMLALHGTRFDEAEAEARVFWTRGARLGDVNVDHSFGALMCTIRWAQGRVVEVLNQMYEMVVRFPAVPAWKCAYAHMLCHAGRVSEANLEFDELMVRGILLGRRDMNWLLAMAQLGEACVELKRIDQAEEIYRALLPYRDRQAVVGYGVLAWGAISRVLGRLAASQRDWTEAETHFIEAERIEANAGSRLWLAYTLFHRAWSLLIEGRSTRAEAAFGLLTRSRAIAEEGGLEQLLPLVKGAQRQAEIQR